MLFKRVFVLIVVAVLFTCCEGWLRWATPEWVHKAGAKGVNYNYGKGPAEDGTLWAPVYDDPVLPLAAAAVLRL